VKGIVLPNISLSSSFPLYDMKNNDVLLPKAFIYCYRQFTKGFIVVFASSLNLLQDSLEVFTTITILHTIESVRENQLSTLYKLVNSRTRS
jgi:hypothetical protein